MGEVRFVPAQPMVQVGGCLFCEDRFPGQVVHLVEKVGDELQVRMCDLCIQSLTRQRNEWALRDKSLASLRKKSRKAFTTDEFGDVRFRKTA